MAGGKKKDTAFKECVDLLADKKMFRPDEKSGCRWHVESEDDSGKYTTTASGTYKATRAHWPSGCLVSYDRGPRRPRRAEVGGGEGGREARAFRQPLRPSATAALPHGASRRKRRPRPVARPPRAPPASSHRAAGACPVFRLS